MTIWFAAMKQTVLTDWGKMAAANSRQKPRLQPSSILYTAVSMVYVVKGEFHTKTHAPLIYPFCHINLPGRNHFCQSCLYFHTGSTPWAAPPPAYNGSQLSSRLVLLGGQLRECSWYGNTDNFGKNDVYQVGCYGKRGKLRVHVFWCGIPL